MSTDRDEEYWDGVAEGTEDGAGGAPFRDAMEGVVETLSCGMISRSDDNERGLEDGREGVHED